MGKRKENKPCIPQVYCTLRPEMTTVVVHHDLKNIPNPGPYDHLPHIEWQDYIFGPRVKLLITSHAEPDRIIGVFVVPLKLKVKDVIHKYLSHFGFGPVWRRRIRVANVRIGGARIPRGLCDHSRHPYWNCHFFHLNIRDEDIIEFEIHDDNLNVV